MSEAKHTPGPWKGDRIDGTVKYSIVGANGDLVLAVQHKSAEYGFIGPNDQADEFLVLAAPDLLKACRIVTAYLDRLEADRTLGPELGAIRRRVHAPLRAALNPAIAKAEGR